MLSQSWHFFTSLVFWIVFPHNLDMEDGRLLIYLYLYLYTFLLLQMDGHLCRECGKQIAKRTNLWYTTKNDIKWWKINPLQIFVKKTTFIRNMGACVLSLEVGTIQIHHGYFVFFVFFFSHIQIDNQFL